MRNRFPSKDIDFRRLDYAPCEITLKNMKLQFQYDNKKFRNHSFKMNFSIVKKKNLFSISFSIFYYSEGKYK